MGGTVFDAGPERRGVDDENELDELGGGDPGKVLELADELGASEELS